MQKRTPLKVLVSKSSITKQSQSSARILVPTNLRGILDLVASERRGNDGNKDNEHEGDGAHCTER